MSMSSASGSTATVAAEVWMRPPDSGLRNPLHPVHARFELQPRKHALAGHGGNDFLVAAGFALACRQHLDTPSLGGGIAFIHAEKITSEQRRFRAAGSGADFDNGTALVGGVLGQQHDLDLLFKLLDPALERLQFVLGHLPHFAVGRAVGQHCREVGTLGLGFPKAPLISATSGCSSEYSEASFT